METRNDISVITDKEILFEGLVNAFHSQQEISKYAFTLCSATENRETELSPKAVLIDVDYLPQKNIQLNKLICKWRNTPLIAYSSTPYPYVKLEELYKNGLNAFVLKSEPLKYLVNCISMLLNQQNLIIGNTFFNNEHFNLTSKELALLEMLSQGKSNKEIAIDLSLALSTIEFYITRIFRKMNVQTRVEAVVKGITYKYIQPTLIS